VDTRSLNLALTGEWVHTEPPNLKIRLVARLTSPFSTKIGYNRDKVEISFCQVKDGQ